MYYQDNKMKIPFVNEENTYQKSVHKNITSNSISWFIFGIMIVLMITMEGTVYYQVVTVSFIVIIGFRLFLKKSIKLSKYYCITIIFILLNIFSVFIGIAVDKSHSVLYISIVSYNLLLFIIIYSFFIYTNDIYKLLYVYVRAVLISGIILIVGNRATLFTGRLGFTWRGSDNSFILLGIQFSPIGSNGIANYCVIAFLFSIFLFLKFKKKRQLIFSLVFLFIILISGSRKALLFLLVSLLIFLNTYFKSNKRILYTTIGVCFCILLYNATQSIPILYNIMGNRINELFNMLLRNNFQDTSISTRQQLINTAMHYFKERPFLGYGMDAFRSMSSFQGICVDNNYLDIAVSSGIIGCIVYYCFIPIVLIEYFSIKKRSIEIKLLFNIIALCLIMQYGSTTYYGRFEGLIFAMFYYVLIRDRYRNKEER